MLSSLQNLSNNVELCFFIYLQFNHLPPSKACPYWAKPSFCYNHLENTEPGTPPYRGMHPKRHMLTSSPLTLSIHKGFPVKKIKHIAMAGALSSTLLLVGCGGSSSSESGAADNSRAISGTATAPAGLVAQYEDQNAFELALSFFISPLAAAITGLEPIEGAAVELIRVDNSGAQVGGVLATTATSITGDYTLTLPEGVNLAGNLVVRITGSNDALHA